jgi:beta-galactosidase GanA
MNLNTVLATVSWELFEPEEGVFDYTLVDELINRSRENGLKLVIVWFGTWKNGESSYVPMWVKRDTDRFFRVKRPDGSNIETISPFCEEAKIADARAFRALMKHVKETDHDHTVIMVQPENEVGIFQDIDYNQQALEKYNQEVPAKLIEYMDQNRSLLKEELLSVWAEGGYKMEGSWIGVFGDNPSAKEFFMAWQYATYINYVASQGKAEHPLPMFVNAWIVQKPDDLPGVYPNGGPVSRVLDIYKAAAPEIDVVCPDIYLPNFKEIVAMYHRSDNPLLVPESTLDAGRAFYAFAQHDAICYSPFAIEDGVNDFLFRQSYAVLHEITHLITKYQGTGKMTGILKEGNEKEQVIQFGNYRLRVEYENLSEPAYGLIIQTEEDAFIVAGMNFKVFFSNEGEKVAYIGQVWEGKYEDEEWIPGRLLNGDETWHNAVLRVFGREHLSGIVMGGQPVNGDTGDPFTYSANQNKIIYTPGIYKVQTYLRD